jgi:hypothetical protein
MTKLLTFLALSLLLVVAVATSSDAQLSGAQDCKDAAKWHREQALKWSLREDQDYHLKAAVAAEELSADGHTCTDWRSDRGQPYYDPNAGKMVDA